jgi:hypothetical protein
MLGAQTRVVLFTQATRSGLENRSAIITFTATSLASSAGIETAN